ncbi:MAG: hypothetical protein AAFP03_11075 [Cyanobacteria bacterium J06598_3]
MTTDNALELAINYLQEGYLDGNKPPGSTDVVAALLAAEKQSKREKRRYTYAKLIGSWRLGFVSGTQTKRLRPEAKPMKTVGKGRFLPRFVTIAIAYEPIEKVPVNQVSTDGLSAPIVTTGDKFAGDYGSVQNSVTLGALNLQLKGPTRFWPKTNSLGFDFTEIRVQLGPLRLYNGGVRGGELRNQEFSSQTLKDQAFFTYFRVQPEYIAARGKGGGLALWVRQS